MFILKYSNYNWRGDGCQQVDLPPLETIKLITSLPCVMIIVPCVIHYWFKSCSDFLMNVCVCERERGGREGGKERVRERLKDGERGGKTHTNI